jgi:hypothetical protein
MLSILGLLKEESNLERQLVRLQKLTSQFPHLVLVRYQVVQFTLCVSGKGIIEQPTSGNMQHGDDDFSLRMYSRMYDRSPRPICQTWMVSAASLLLAICRGILTEKK